MKITSVKNFTLLVFAVVFVYNSMANEVTASPPPNIIIQAMAEGEIQPQLLHDKEDRVHLVYFKVEDSKTRMGNLFYKQFKHEDNSWSEAIQISQQAYRQPDVIATAKLAVDGQGRVHVTWLGHKPTAFLYSRSDASSSDSRIKSFTPQRSLVSQNLEGAEASAVISAHKNTVTVTWMAGVKESLRTVYTMTSNDNGSTFGAEAMIGDQSIGGCACCGYASDYSDSGELLVAYRSATNGNGRHMQLISMLGDQISTQLVDKWEYSACPVSTNDLIHDNKGNNWLTWETAGEVFASKIYASKTKASEVENKKTEPFLVSEAKPEIRQKHPVMGINDSGYQLIAWSEGDGYYSGGEVKLQLYDPQSKVIDAPSTKDLHPAQFSNVAVSSLANDSFLLLY